MSRVLLDTHLLLLTFKKAHNAAAAWLRRQLKAQCTDQPVKLGRRKLPAQS